MARLSPFLFLVLSFSVVYASDFDPLSIHLAFVSDNTEMAVTWLTMNQTTTSQVSYGTDMNSLDHAITSDSQTTYNERRDSDAGWNHNVVLTGLQPNTTYYYSCGDPSLSMSNVLSFTTITDEFEPFVIATNGDLGVDFSHDSMELLLNMAREDKVDLFIHMGDISYANDHPLRYEKIWREWFADMEPATAKIPYMVCAGNHESWCRNPICAIPTRNFTTYKEKFRMPGNESGTGTNMFYSFDFHNIHFVAIDTEQDYPNAPYFDPEPVQMMEEELSSFTSFGERDSQKEYAQINWLHQDLQKAVANRDNVPFIIIFGHRPIYTPSDLTDEGTPTGSALHVQNFLEPILEEYNVDIYLSGHTHSFARTYPVVNSTMTSSTFTDPIAPVHIVAGGPGSEEGLSVFPSDLPSYFAATYDSDYGVGTMTVNAKNSITWNYYRSSTGGIIDTFTLEKTL